ncbi:MAG TPA: hypothetical protein VLF60_02505 [Candidatus Saccharimonadales bacterium]|nr:hypothetical protein [Candidatus Saccharimonadales bacterium]
MQRPLTQIGSQPHTRKSSLIACTSQLHELDIAVTDPIDISTSSSPWAAYESELHFYDSISRSSFHIVWNEDGEITAALALQILHAMAKSKPIVLVKKPIFHPEVDAFTREVIVAHIKDMTIANLPKLEAAELNFILKNLSQQDYSLSAHELTLISSRVKASFRRLLEQAKSELGAPHLEYATK